MAGVLEIGDGPQPVATWAGGTERAREVAARLDGVASADVHVLHDRSIPGVPLNVDHLVVAPNGVYVVTSMIYTGRVERRDKGSLRHVDLRLYIGNRDRSHLLDGIARQATALRRALGLGVPIHPVLCFVGSDWGVLTRPFQVSGVLITWPRALGKQVQAKGPIGPSVAQLALELDGMFPPAGRGGTGGA